ncbi:MAG: leucine-rich repeat protein [Mycoplasma sp.]
MTKKAKIIWGLLTSTIILGGVGTGVYFLLTPTPNVEKNTIINDKNFNGTLTEFKTEIKYKNATTPIQNFENFFEVENGVKDAEYFITNLDVKNETKTMVLKIKVSKSFDTNSDIINDKIFDVNLTFLQTPQTIIKDKVFDGFLTDFKTQINYQNSTTPIQNFENFFEVQGGVTNAEYFITNLETRTESKTMELKIKVSKSIDDKGEEVDNKIFNVILTFDKVPQTTIPNKTFEGNINEFKTQINYQDSITAIENFETFFKVENGLTDAEYFISGLDSKNETKELNLEVRVSKSVDADGEEVENKIFDVILTLFKIPETTIQNKSINETLREFKKMIGYQDSTTPIDNFETFFNVENGLEDAKYTIINLNTSNKQTQTETTTLQIKVSKSIDETEKEVQNKIFEVSLTTNKDWVYEMFSVSKEGVLTVNSISTWDYNEWKGGLFIPKEMDGIKIKTIGLPEFNDRFAAQIANKVTSLIFEEGIELEIINNYAFSDCLNMWSELELPDTLVSIGKDAFYGCRKLFGSIKFPPLLTEIKEGTFKNCTDLTGDLIIPNSITSIGKNAFENCSKLTGDLIIPDSIETIDSYAFDSCSLISSISVTNQLFTNHNTTWSQGYWNNQDDETSNVINYQKDIDIVDGKFTISKEGVLSITNISQWDYNSWNGELVIPKTVQARNVISIPDNFTSQIKDKVTSLIFDETIQLNKIGENAFKDCINLSGNLRLPGTLKELGKSAFQNCEKLTGDLRIPNSVSQILEDTFNGCSGFDGKLFLPSRITEIKTKAFYGCSNLTGELEIPSTANELGVSVFGGCSKIASITVSNKLFNDHKTIWSQDYWNNQIGFKSNVIDKEGDVYSEIFTLSRNGALSINDISQWDYENWNGELTIPSQINGVKVVMTKNSSSVSSAFAYQIKDKLKTLTFEEGIQIISSNSFNGCSNLTGDLNLPNSLEEIAASAFKDCSGFDGKLNIQNGLRVIGNNAFETCSGFTGDLTLPDSIISVGNYAFNGCSGFNGDLRLSSGLSKINNNVFASCSNLKSIQNIPENLQSIGNLAFNDCSRLSGDIIIPNTVTSIGSQAFTKAGLTSITVSENLFENHQSTWSQGYTGKVFNADAIVSDMFSITQDGVLSIANTTLWDYENWEGDLVIPNKVADIEVKSLIKGSSAFNFISQISSKLKTITFEENSKIEVIGDYAFGNLKKEFFTGEITLPDSVKIIGFGTFRTSTGFTGDFKFPANLVEIQDRAFQEAGFTGDIDLVNTQTTSIGQWGFYNSQFNGRIMLPEGLLSIGTQAFRNLSKVYGTLDVPSSVEEIGSNAFDTCSNLHEIIVSNKLFTDHKTTWSQNYSGTVIDKGVDMDIVNAYSIDGDGTLSLNDVSTWNYDIWNGKLIIPTTVNGVKVKKIKDGVGPSDNFTTQIKDKMTSLVFEEDSELEVVGNYAFMGCTKTKGNLNLPDSLITVSDFAFPTTAFTGDLIIPNNVLTIGTSAFHSMKGLTGKLVIGDSVELIKGNAFFDCSNLTGDLIVPDSVETIMNDVFSGCSIPTITVKQSLYDDRSTWNRGYTGEIKPK